MAVQEFLHSIENVTLLVGGVALTALAPGNDAIIVTYKSPLFTDVAGCDGNAVASRIVDNRADVKVKLLQTSPSNEYLSEIVLSVLAGVYVPTPFLLRDVGGTTLYTAPNVYVSERPAVSYGAEQNIREWTFSALQMRSFIGGGRVIS